MTFHLDIKRAALKPHIAIKPKVDLSQYVTEMLYARSADGKRVPFFVRYKKGIKFNGENPTILTGFGGFNRHVDPSFSYYELAWMEQGGVCAQAILRGGAGMGTIWRYEGTREKKQNTFNDFIAVAKALIRKRITKSSRLGIRGYSNGGLLIAAVLTQQAKLFGAALMGAGLADMLRYHKFGTEKQFAHEYGTANKMKEFKVLQAYSPLQNVRKGKYTPVLVSTASHDDRVSPAHSFKFAAMLQKQQAGDAPILLHVEMNAGHAGSAHTNRGVEELAFFGITLGLFPDCYLKWLNRSPANAD